MRLVVIRLNWDGVHAPQTQSGVQHHPQSWVTDTMMLIQRNFSALYLPHKKIPGLSEPQEKKG